MNQTHNKILERYSWCIADNNLRSLGVFIGVLELLQGRGAELSKYALESFISQLDELKDQFQEVLDREKERR